MPSDELKPVDSQVFVWKPKNIVKTDTNYNNKVIDKNKVKKNGKVIKNKDKIHKKRVIKPIDKSKADKMIKSILKNKINIEKQEKSNSNKSLSKIQSIRV